MAGVDFDPYLSWTTSTAAFHQGLISRKTALEWLGADEGGNLYNAEVHRGMPMDKGRVVCAHCECYVLRDRPTCEQCGSPLGRSIAKEPA